MPLYDTLWINAHLATMRRDGGAFGALRDAALASKDGKIAWLGPMADLSRLPERPASDVVDAGGRWITPGFGHPHTHFIFAGAPSPISNGGPAAKITRRRRETAVESIIRSP